MTISCAHKKYQRGFTLTELTIVLLIIGFIVGGIWVAAGTVWNNYRVYRTNQQIASITQNIRDFYLNISVWPDAIGADITKKLDQNNLLPVEMRRNPTAGAGGGPIDHVFNNNYTSGATAPVNGSFAVRAAADLNGKDDAFVLVYQGLTQAPCVKFLSSIPVVDSELGIIKIGAQGSPTATTSMISASQAQVLCNAAGAGNEVDIVFKLRM